MNYKPSLILTLLLAVSSLSADPVVYEVDPVHSGVTFKVRHLLNKIPGTFAKFDGEIHFDKEHPENSKAIGTVQVNSVDTRNEKRDKHLQGEDFFKSDNNPVIEFSSTQWKPIGENKFIVSGILKMIGMEHPIELELTYLGEMESRGAMKSGWEGKVTLDRTDWGMTYGTAMVGTEIEIELNIQARRQ